MPATAKKLPYYAAGWKQSKTSKFMDCYDPSTGEVIAQAPQCTVDEVNQAVAAAAAAFPAWADTPPNKRVQVLFKMKALLDKHLDELTRLVATEHGKVLDEAMGDAIKVTELVEFACGGSREPPAGRCSPCAISAANPRTLPARGGGGLMDAARIAVTLAGLALIVGVNLYFFGRRQMRPK